MKYSTSNVKGIVPQSVAEFFLSPPQGKTSVCYQPQIIGLAKLHFVDKAARIDMWRDVCVIAKSEEEGKIVDWEQGSILSNGKKVLQKSPQAGSSFAELPGGMMQEKKYALFQKNFTLFLLQNQTYSIFKASDLGLISMENESEADFRIRLAFSQREKRDAMVKALHVKYEKQMATLPEKIQRAQAKVTERQQNATIQKAETWISAGTTILGGLLGRGITKSTISNAGSSMRRVGKLSRDSQQVSEIEQDCQKYQKQLSDLQAICKMKFHRSL